MPDRRGGADACDEPRSASALSLDSAPRPSARCAWQVFEGEAVIIDLEGHRLMGLNPTGSLVWGLLNGRRSLAEISGAVADRFQVPPERAAADVSAFAELLSRRGFIET
jgi:hypothetical protein